MKSTRITAVGLLSLFLLGCGMEISKGDTPRSRREIAPGPGVLSGEDGEFVIFRARKKPKKTDQTETEQKESQTESQDAD